MRMDRRAALLWAGVALPTYYGQTATGLTPTRYNTQSGSNGVYAVFAGGYGPNGEGGNKNFDDVDAYNTSLVHATPAGVLPVAWSFNKLPIAGEVGGLVTLNMSAYDHWIVAYNTSLVQSTVTNNTRNKSYYGVASLGDYVIYAGGTSGGSNTLEAWNGSLTKYSGTISNLSRSRRDLGGQANDAYAIFAGGCASSTSTVYSDVDAYNSSLVKASTVDALAAARYQVASARAGNTVVFYGGSPSSANKTIDGYNSSLVHVYVTNATAFSNMGGAASLGNFALFNGGATISYGSKRTIAVNQSLVQTELDPPTSEHGSNSAATIGDFALFAGGRASNLDIADVDVYRK